MDDNATLDAYRATLPSLLDWLRYRLWALRIPGAQLAIAYRGEVLLSDAWGYSDVESARPMTTRTLIRIASHSKTFTATALLQLAESGALRLDDTVGTHVAELTTAGSRIADATLRELLEHGGGVLRDGADSDYWELARPFPDEDELLRLVLENGSKTPPGASFGYSNLGYSLLGLVIARVTGTSYEQHVLDAIVRPLGLRDTGPDWDADRADEYATGYSNLATARERSRVPHAAANAMASATGFYGTAEDLVRYASAHVVGRGSLLSDHSKRIAQRRAWSADDRDPGARGYGAGFIVDRVGGREIRGHSGGYPGFTTQTVFDPASSLAISVTTTVTSGPATALAAGVLALLDEAADAESPAIPDGIAVTDFTGRFAGPWGVTDIARIGDRLLAIDPTAESPLTHPTRLRAVDADTLLVTHGDRFGSVDESIRYERADDGTARSIRVGGMTLLPWETPPESPAVAAGLAAGTVGG